jgi:23S rRNA pseudouridine955/2504/2580 synthase
MSSRVETIAVSEDEGGMRLDRWFRRRYPALPQSHLNRSVRKGEVRVEGKRVEISTRLEAGQKVRVPPMTAPPEKAAPVINPADAEYLRGLILFEDRDVMVLNKPWGLASQGGSGTKRHVDGMLASLADRNGERPVLVHRLDRDTSGVLLVAKNAAIHAALTRSLRSRHGEKDYLALAYGTTPFAHGRIELGILRDPTDLKRRMASRSEGKESVTLWLRLAEAGGLTLLSCRLVTGRTHQIRVHLASQGWPIVGDPLYGEPRWKGIAEERAAAACRDFARQALHAWRLSFLHPATGERLVITAPVPEDLTALLAATGLSWSET